MQKTLGKSNISVSPLGFGCWAIGGHFTLDGLADGWGEVDNAESIHAIRRAADMGVTFFDTADVYGTGQSEEVLGQAVQGFRDRVVIATKFGYPYKEWTREVSTKYDVSPDYVRGACEKSLRRLGTDYIDLYQLHVGMITDEEMRSVADTLDGLKREGKIRSYGWSTWDLASAETFAAIADCDAIQYALNVLKDSKDMIKTCERKGMSSIINSPLAMGFLSGKFGADSRLPSDDVRGSGHEWVSYFKDGRPLQSFLDQLDAVRDVLTADGRSLVQGALGWIWARSDAAIPIPGIKTVRQAEEIARAMDFGPLSAAQMAQIEAILRPSE